jgi:hypothetical protein
MHAPPRGHSVKRGPILTGAGITLRGMKARPLWGTARPGADPRLKSAAWKETREHWRREGKRLELQCWRCGGKLGPILSDVWYVPGTRRVHPSAYCLGHVVSRDLGASLGYDPEWLDSIENTRPEHNYCSARSGYMAQSGKRRMQALASAQRAASTPRKSGKRARPPALPPRPVTQAAAASRWQ